MPSGSKIRSAKNVPNDRPETRATSTLGTSSPAL
jgi:hypothetical protein